MGISTYALFKARTGRSPRAVAVKAETGAPRAPRRFEPILPTLPDRPFRADARIYFFLAQVCFWLVILLAAFARKH